MVDVIDDDTNQTPAHRPIKKTTNRPVQGPAAMGVRLGDALDILSNLPANCIDAVITDPPYGLNKNDEMVGQVNYNYHLSETHGRGYRDCDPDAYREWFTLIAIECERVLKPGGYLLSFAGCMTAHLVGTAVQCAGFDIRDQMTWVRGGSAPRGLTLRGDDGTVRSTTPAPGHEPIVCGQKWSEGTYRANQAKWGTGFVNVSESDRWTGANGPWPRTAFEYPRASRAERDLVPGANHPTVKPLALMRELVRLYVPVGGIVLDPFAGSGTTAEAAILERRHYLTVERDTRYLSHIAARIKRAREG